MATGSFVQIGAGNIGRSFVAQLFSRAGFEVVFIDVADDVISALNERRSYRIEVKDRMPETIHVENVRGVHGTDVEAAAQELASCVCCATAVGPNALPHIAPTLALGLIRRQEAHAGPLDVIICENMRGAAQAMRSYLTPHLPPGFPLDDMVGLVETSIGKMVPIMSEEERAKDPLLVFAEAYNTLICDAGGFKNPVPDVPGLEPKANMAAYVDRKSFIHNLGHALCAYLGFIEDPSLDYTWQAVEHPVIGPQVRAGMWESGRALINQYPNEFNEDNQGEHIEDLLGRFANKALGDTLHRVGRDIRRKLSHEDRVIGALLCDLRNGVEPTVTARCAAAGMLFQKPDEHGRLFSPDEAFAAEMLPRGIDCILAEVCGLERGKDPDDRAIALIKAAFAAIQGNG